MDTELDQKYYTCTQAAQITGLSRFTWKSYANSGKVSSVKIDRKVLIPATEIKRVIDAGFRPAATPTD